MMHMYQRRFPDIPERHTELAWLTLGLGAFLTILSLLFR